MAEGNLERGDFAEIRNFLAQMNFRIRPPTRFQPHPGRAKIGKLKSAVYAYLLKPAFQGEKNTPGGTDRAGRDNMGTQLPVIAAPYSATPPSRCR